MVLYPPQSTIGMNIDSLVMRFLKFDLGDCWGVETSPPTICSVLAVVIKSCQVSQTWI